jgi:hypothetical protein
MSEKNDTKPEGIFHGKSTHLDYCLISCKAPSMGGEISKERYRYFWEKYIWEDTEFLD